MHIFCGAMEKIVLILEFFSVSCYVDTVKHKSNQKYIYLKKCCLAIHKTFVYFATNFVLAAYLNF